MKFKFISDAGRIFTGSKRTKILKLLFILGLLTSIFVIFVNSSIDLYLKRGTILGKFGIDLKYDDDADGHHSGRVSPAD